MYHNVFTNHLPNWPMTMIAASGWWEYPQPTRQSWEEHSRMNRLMSYTHIPRNPWYTWVKQYPWFADSPSQILLFGVIPDPHFPDQAWPYGGWPLALLDDFNASTIKFYAGTPPASPDDEPKGPLLAEWISPPIEKLRRP